MLTTQRGASWVAQLVKNLPAMQETSSIPELGSSPGKRIGYPLQNSWVSLVAQMVKKVKKKESEVAQSCPTLCDPMDYKPTKLLHAWDFTSKNISVGCRFLLLGIFLTQESNLGLLHCRQTLYPLSHQGTQMVKNPPANQEAWVQSLGCENPLEEGMAIHSSILTWRIPMDRRAWQAAVHGVTKSWTQLRN